MLLKLITIPGVNIHQYFPQVSTPVTRWRAEDYIILSAAVALVGNQGDERTDVTGPYDMPPLED